MPKKVHCSFCGKIEDEVQHLIEGPNGVYICEECIAKAGNIINGNYEEEDCSGSTNLMKPKEIKAALDEYVVGQDAAKKALSVAVYNHYKRIFSNSKDDIDIQKSNVLMVGATGSGKTYLAQTLARILNVPFAIADATTLTQAGYVGDDVENILLKLIQNADYEIERAEQGIIYIDEIDKINRKSENVSISRDVSGEGVQQALLKILEGTEAAVPPQGGRKHPGQENLKINTKNILFICGGAFEGLDKILEKEEAKSSIGFNRENGAVKESRKLKHLIPQDFIKFGMLPEFMGRLPVITVLDDLTEDALVHILTEPKNAITKQYEKLFKMDNIKLRYENDALIEIAHKAMERKTGARGLRAIMEETMQDLMFELPSQKAIKECTVTKEMVDKTNDIEDSEVPTTKVAGF